MGKTIGIDLGTTNSVVAFKDATVRVLTTGSDNQELCRSCVAVDASGSFLVGNTPYKNWKRHAPNIVVSVKRLMGAAISDPQVQKMQKDKDMYPYGITKLSGGTEDSVAVVMNGREYTPEQISAEILRQLKNDAANKLNDEVTHAVITVPAYFNEKQKSATRKAAELAGLKVQRLLAEPTAAAISYGADKMSKNEDKIFLVYDFGGGTFDLSILVASGGNFIESGTGGDRWLGGDDIDRLISEYVISEASKANGGADIHKLIDALSDRKKYAFQGEFKSQVEDAKKSLSSDNTKSVTISLYDHLETEDGDPIDIEVPLTRKKFEDMIRPLVQRTLDLIDELLEKTAYPIDTIDNILLVGGSSCIPLVRQMLSEKYGAEKILSSEKPMLAIAEGAAILSHSMGTESECPHCGKLVPVGVDECPHCHTLMSDVASEKELEEGKVQVSITTKHKYFIQTADDADNVEYTMIIDENEVLPNEVSRKFYTLVDNQKIIGVKLFSDAEDGKMDKLSTGFFTIPESLPVHSELQFTFRLNANETMDVKVRVAATGKTTNVVLGRGSLDQHCLDSISANFDRVMGDSGISDIKKSEYLEKLQKTIELISAGGLTPESRDWQDIEHKLDTAVSIAQTKDSEKNVYAIIAKIQLENFGRFMRDEDKNAMRSELAKVENASTPMAKNEALGKLEELTDKYSLFTHGFMFNIVGHKTSDPANANKALVVFNQFMAALNAGDVDKARELLAANESLLAGLGASNPFGGTTGIGA